MSTENAVQRYERQSLPIATIADLGAIGQMVAQSGMFGSCTPGKGAVIAATCQQEGMSLLEFKRTFHVTDRGEVSMRSDRMLAEFRLRGGQYKWTEFSATRAAAIWTYRENEGVEIDYTIEQARAAGLVRSKSAWESDPAAMLRARLISKAVRMLCPEAIAGVYTPEELEDVRNGGPVDIPAQTIAPAAATIIDAEITPFDTKPPIDYNLCPIGKSAGMRWADMPLEHLELALTIDNPAIEPEHRAAIEQAIREYEREPSNDN